VKVKESQKSFSNVMQEVKGSRKTTEETERSIFNLIIIYNNISVCIWSQLRGPIGPFGLLSASFSYRLNANSVTI